MMKSSLFWYIFIVINQRIFGWPDGSPCLRNAMDSMNPLEAVEHQGGLQLTKPPYDIKLNADCYWPYQDIRVIIESKNNVTFFRGFALQARVYKSKSRSEIGKRTGNFTRDDNGSWRYQCFRFHDGITHSHHERKNKLTMWWRTNNDNNDRYVQFVATVAESLLRFWVKSVLSVPLPPCRISRKMTNYHPPPVTRPPPVVNRLKINSRFRLMTLISSKKLDKSRGGPKQKTPEHNDIEQSTTPIRRLEMSIRIKTTTIPTELRECHDFDGGLCSAWKRYCGSNSDYLKRNCQKTCGFCMPE